MKSRKPLFAIAVLLLIAAGVFWLRRSPPPDDRERILSAIEAMRRAGENRDAGGVMRHLSNDFRWQGQSKRELRTQLAGYFFTNDAIRVQIDDTIVKIDGQSATSEGGYQISTRAAFDAPFESRGGRFTLKWRKIDGEWKVESASGGENLAF